MVTLKAEILLSIIQFNMTHCLCNSIRQLHNNIINQGLKNDSIEFSNKAKPRKKRKKPQVLPEQTCHGVAADVVQGRVVLVLLSIRCVWVQAIPELRVALIQLPGQGLVATHQGLAELGGCVAHGFKLAKGRLKGAVADARLPACLPACQRLPPPPLPPPPFTTGDNLEQHGSALSCPASERERERLIRGKERWRDKKQDEERIEIMREKRKVWKKEKKLK